MGRGRHTERIVAARRALILEAAQRVFARDGLAQASLRAIAREAGCTTGAIYPSFGSKEALYAAALEASLDALHDHLAQALAQAPDAHAARAVARAFYDYYAQRPAELSLGFYLFQGLAPRGLGPDLDRALNARLTRCVALLGAGLARTRPAPGHDLARMQMFTYLSGLLLLRHTGRLKSLAQDADVLLDDYCRTLEALP
ncbi:TetR family transcriptional regulator [Bordetella sp. N]|nr:TetR family transcriptional regulator [Bordetella sp. N]